MDGGWRATAGTHHFIDNRWAAAAAGEGPLGMHSARQLRVARRLNCGQAFVNNYGAGGDIELPFGGVKSSGYGRATGFEALLGFSRVKTIAIRHG